MRAALGRAQRVHGAHVVRAVGELDEDDAQVAHHRQQHLAEALGLRLLAALEADLIELGDAIDDLGDVVAEARAISSLAIGVSSMTSWRIAATIVSVSRCRSRGSGRGDRMGDIGLAAEARLALVVFRAEIVGRTHLLTLFWGQMIEARQQLPESRATAGEGQPLQEQGAVVHGPNPPQRRRGGRRRMPAGPQFIAQFVRSRRPSGSRCRRAESSSGLRPVFGQDFRREGCGVDGLQARVEPCGRGASACPPDPGGLREFLGRHCRPASTGGSPGGRVPAAKAVTGPIAGRQHRALTQATHQPTDNRADKTDVATPITPDQHF